MRLKSAQTKYKQTDARYTVYCYAVPICMSLSGLAALSVFRSRRRLRLQTRLCDYGSVGTGVVVGVAATGTGSLLTMQAVAWCHKSRLERDEAHFELEAAAVDAWVASK